MARFWSLQRVEDDENGEGSPEVATEVAAASKRHAAAKHRAQHCSGHGPQDAGTVMSLGSFPREYALAPYTETKNPGLDWWQHVPWS